MPKDEEQVRVVKGRSMAGKTLLLLMMQISGNTLEELEDALDCPTEEEGDELLMVRRLQREGKL